MGAAAGRRKEGASPIGGHDKNWTSQPNHCVDRPSPSYESTTILILSFIQFAPFLEFICRPISMCDRTRLAVDMTNPKNKFSLPLFVVLLQLRNQSGLRLSKPFSKKNTPEWILPSLCGPAHGPGPAGWPWRRAAAGLGSSPAASLPRGPIATQRMLRRQRLTLARRGGVSSSRRVPRTSPLAAAAPSTPPRTWSGAAAASCASALSTSSARRLNPSQYLFIVLRGVARAP